MSSLLTAPIAAMIWILAIQPAVAFERTALQTFSQCAGRLSAVMEYQWMFNGEASEQTKVQRAHVLEMIAAVIEPHQGRQVLEWRLNAKHAQSVLLTRATFNEDPADAAWAASQAERLVQDCRALLLS